VGIIIVTGSSLMWEPKGAKFSLAPDATFEGEVDPTINSGSAFPILSIIPLPKSESKGTQT
jgi:hypothetical protein